MVFAHSSFAFAHSLVSGLIKGFPFLSRDGRLCLFDKDFNVDDDDNDDGGGCDFWGNTDDGDEFDGSRIPAMMIIMIVKVKGKKDL